jgi:serine/threonine-protein kinase
MPPEQVKGLAIDARADLFAVGATMFRLLARRRLHEGNSEAHLLIKSATESVPPLASVAPHLPREVGLIVDRALAFQVAQRYPDARTMQSDVRDVLRGEPPRAAIAFLNTGEFGSNIASGPTSTSTPAVSIRTAGPPVSGDAPTMMAIAAPAPDPRSIAQSAASWPGEPPLPETIFRPAPAEASGPAPLVRAPTGSAISPLLLAIGAGTAGLFVLVAIGLVIALTRGPSADADASGGVAAGPRAGGAKSRDDDKSRRGARPDEPWCGGGECDFDCDSRCDMACSGGRCNIEVKFRAKVTCAGSGECALWCDDDCAVKCPGDASCTVHCKPGKRCTLDTCPTATKTCANGTLVCGRKCPD